MRRIATTALLYLLAATPAMALVSGAGHIYEGWCNAHGYVIQSKYPVGRFLGVGADGPTIGIETIYLGKGCDAFSEAFGSGEWGWANGGFTVDFPSMTFGFPRQEVFCADGEPQHDFSSCWR